jgi:hypothetical protein
VDENLGGSFVQRLHAFGHDVAFGPDIGGRSRTDVWHFRQALTEGRILLTFNTSDFRYLHRLWTTLRILDVVQTGHAGILTTEGAKGYTPHEWLPVVQARLEIQDDLRERMFVWHPPTQRWEEDAWKPED